MKNNIGTMLMATMVGAAIGAGLGILYAPSKGSKTRKKIKNAVEDTTDDVSGWLKSTKDDITKTVRKKEDKFENKIESSLSK